MDTDWSRCPDRSIITKPVVAEDDEEPKHGNDKKNGG
jgi:hypothetical protein